jgi:hypothetical protein
MDTSIGTEKAKIYRGTYIKKRPLPVKIGVAVENI